MGINLPPNSKQYYHRQLSFRKMSARGGSRRHSRSRSRSFSPRGGGRSGGYGGSGGAGPSRRRSRSASRSPMSNRRRHVESRDAPGASTCLGVFGLSLYTTERELEKEFSKFGPLQKLQVVLDGKTGRSRGFAFVYFEAIEDAKAAKDDMCDTEIDGRKIRVDFSITKRSHTPTPGVYMGKPTYRNESRGGGYRGGGGGGYRDDRGYGGREGGGYYSRRSPSPYYRGGGGGGGGRRRDYRSRSRSYSPRR